MPAWALERVGACDHVDLVETAAGSDEGGDGLTTTRQNSSTSLLTERVFLVRLRTASG